MVDGGRTGHRRRRSPLASIRRTSGLAALPRRDAAPSYRSPRPLSTSSAAAGRWNDASGRRSARRFDPRRAPDCGTAERNSQVGQIGTAQKRSIRSPFAEASRRTGGSELLSAVRASAGVRVAHRPVLVCISDTAAACPLAIGVVACSRSIRRPSTLTRPRQEAPVPAFGAVRSIHVPPSRRCRSGRSLARVPRRRPGVGNLAPNRICTVPIRRHGPHRNYRADGHSDPSRPS